MRNIEQIRATIRANPGAVLQVWPTYTPDAFNDPKDALMWGWNPNAHGGEIVLRLGRYSLCFPARPGESAFEPITPSLIILATPQPAKMRHWGLVKLGPSVWAVTPSVHLPDAFHGYVTLCEVPEPAPWEGA